MKIAVDHEQCTGHGRCNAVAPDLFPLDDTGRTTVHETETGDEDGARRAVASCPERAIDIQT